MLFEDTFTVYYSGTCTEESCKLCGTCSDNNEIMRGLSMFDVVEMNNSDEYWLETTCLHERTGKVITTSSVIELHKEYLNQWS